MASSEKSSLRCAVSRSANDDHADSEDKEVSYDDPCVNNFVSAQLRRYYRDGDYTDVTLKAGSVSLDAHKVILAAASAFFDAQFSYVRNSASSQEGDIIELQCDGDVLKEVIDYIYYGTIKISHRNVVCLMELQDYLQIVSLRNLISHFILHQLNDNLGVYTEALHLKKTAECFRYHDLASEMFFHVRKRFYLLLHLPEFLGMPLELLLECLQSDFLVYGDEDDLLIGLCKWMCANTSKQSAYEKLIAHVDPSSITRWSITHEFALSVLKDDPVLQSKLDHWFGVNEQARMNSERGGRSRYKNSIKPVLMSLGGLADIMMTGNPLPVPTVDCIVSWSSEKWRPMIPTVNDSSPSQNNAVPVPLMLHPRIRPVVACNGFNVYVTGGGTNCVEMYDSLKNQWLPLPDAPAGIDASKAAMAVLDDSLYLIVPDPDVEMPPLFMVLHKNSSNWHMMVSPDMSSASMSSKLPTLVSSLSSLYLLTSGERKEDKLVRRYDVNLDLWCVFSVQPLSGYSHICSCVVYNHVIFIIFNNGILFSFNTINQEWTKKGHKKDDVSQSLSTRYNSFVSSKFGYEIVLADEANTNSMYLFSLTGRRSNWLNKRRFYCGLAHFNLGLYGPPSI